MGLNWYGIGLHEKIISTKLMEMRKPITLLLLAFGMLCGVAVKGQLMITEIMYQSPCLPSGQGDSLEYLELYNHTDTVIDLTGYTMVGVGVSFVSVSLDPGQRMYVCRNSTGFSSFFPSLVGESFSSGTLSNTGESLVLKDPNGVTVDSVFYSNVSPWPSQGAGDGYSITLCDVESDNSNGANWSACNTPASGIVVQGLQIYANPNTCCAYTDVTPPTITGVKFTNYNRVAIGFSEVLSKPSTWLNNFSCNAGISSATFGPAGDSIILMLSTPLSDGEFDTVHVSGVSDKACNTIAPTSFYIVNNYLASSLKISEVMYDDPTSGDSLEFFEIYSSVNGQISLGGLRLGGDLTGVLPDVTLSAGERVAILHYFTTASAAYAAPRVYGGWETGTLGDQTGTIQILSDAGMVGDLTYQTTGFWPTGANGTGYSIKMCDETSAQQDPGSWSIGTPGDFTVVHQGDSIFATPGRINCRPVGVDHSLAESTTVFPNPFSGQFEIQTRTDIHHASLCDLFGRKIAEFDVVEGHATLDTPDLAKGVYFLNLYSETANMVLSRRVVKL